MATMNVSLPDPMKEWVEARMKHGKFSNTSDYVRRLLRRDQEGHRADTAPLEPHYCAAVTRQMTSPTSSAIRSDLLSGPTVTPTGRP